jgi:hypothetical protein
MILGFIEIKNLKIFHQNCAVAFGLQLKDVFVGQISGKLALLKKIIYILINDLMLNRTLYKRWSNTQIEIKRFSMRRHTLQNDSLKKI